MKPNARTCRGIVAWAITVGVTFACSSTPSVVVPEPVEASALGTAETPQLQELLDLGVDRSDAECFLARLDPEATGTYTDPTGEIFEGAFKTCFPGED